MTRAEVEKAERKEETRKLREAEELEEAMRHAAQLVTEEMRAHATAAMPGYLWRDKKDRKGMRAVACTRCGYRGELPDGRTRKQRSIEKCPACGAAVECRDLWRGRKYMRDEAFITWYRKSAVDPETVVSVGAWCERDYRTTVTPGAVVTRVIPCCVCVFKYGAYARRFECRDAYAWKLDGERGAQRWWKMTECKSGYFIKIGWKGFFANLVHEDSHREAIAGTPFARVWFDGIGERSRYDDHIDAMSLIARYPCLEYLVKMGQKELVRERVRSPFARGLVNWRGKSAQGVLHLTGGQLREIRREKIELTEVRLEYARIARQCGADWTMARILEMESLRDLNLLKRMSTEFQPLNLGKLVGYLRKQQGARSGASDLADYWRECVELGMDLRDDMIAYPKDLREAHARTTSRIKYLRDQALDEAIQNRLKKLSAYRFEACGLLLRPMAGTQEIIDEGNALKHCVGGYAKGYAEGRTILCALRRAEAPDEPFHTVEFSKEGRLVQCRGKGNRTEAEDKPLLEAFWRAYEARRETKGRKTA